MGAGQTRGSRVPPSVAILKKSQFSTPIVLKLLFRIIPNPFRIVMTVAENTNMTASAPVSTDKSSAAVNLEEHQYLELVREILDEGELRRDR